MGQEVRLTPDECDRQDGLFEVKVRKFTHTMARHGCHGKAVYYLTEMMVLWPDIGYDREHSWLLN
jgi:hypothetical protein